MDLMSSDFRSITRFLPFYSMDPLTTSPIRSGGGLLLVLKDGLPAQEDEELPSTGYVVSAVRYLYLVGRPVGMRCSHQ